MALQQLLKHTKRQVVVLIRMEIELERTYRIAAVPTRDGQGPCVCVVTAYLVLEQSVSDLVGEWQ